MKTMIASLVLVVAMGAAGFAPGGQAGDPPILVEFNIEEFIDCAPDCPIDADIAVGTECSSLCTDVTVFRHGGSQVPLVPRVTLGYVITCRFDFGVIFHEGDVFSPTPSCPPPGEAVSGATPVPVGPVDGPDPSDLEPDFIVTFGFCVGRAILTHPGGQSGSDNLPHPCATVTDV